MATRVDLSAHDPWRLGKVEIALVALVAASGLLAARAYPLWRSHWYVACPAWTIFGIPCPACGATRALAALAAGRWAEALAWNPLAAIAGAGAAIWLLMSALVLSGVMRAPRVPPRLSPSVSWAFGAVVALNWLYLMFWFTG